MSSLSAATATVVSTSWWTATRPTAPRHAGVATGDFNADGKLDAVVSDVDTNTVSMMLGNADGTLRYAGAFAAGQAPTDITVGDFNRDGRLDVAVTGSTPASDHRLGPAQRRQLASDESSPTR